MIHSFSDGKRSAVIKALCTLSKFLGMHTEYTAMIKNYGLKWAGRSDDDIIIDRLSKNTDTKPLIEWIKNAQKIPELKELLDLIIATGLRLIEAIECYRLIITLNQQGTLSNYYNRERQIFEHFRFKSVFIRNSKKVFISFVPYRIVETIAAVKQPIDYDKAQRLAEYYLKKLRFADLRELYASVSVKNLRESEIDFMQGRISSRVFLRNYFNPQFIDDLQERALKNAEELLTLCR
jgi:intergrase/recombinase